jgi:hypothetical protein
MKHVAPTILFLPYFVRTCMQLLNVIPIMMFTFRIYLLPLDNGLDMGRHA